MAVEHQIDLVLGERGSQACLIPASEPLSVEEDMAHWCIWTTIQSMLTSARAVDRVCSSHCVCALGVVPPGLSVPSPFWVKVPV